VNTATTEADQAAHQAAVAAADKRFQNLRALFALQGWELHIVGDGNGGAAFQAHRWGYAATLHSLDAAEAFARTVGAA
jgi:hypothetical protein